MAKIAEHRTQVYLPSLLHARLKRYADDHGLSIAQVIRTSVESLLGAPDTLDDPLMRMVGAAGGFGVTDASEGHDQYLYGDQSSTRSKSRGGPNREVTRGRVAGGASAKPSSSAAKPERPLKKQQA